MVQQLCIGSAMKEIDSTKRKVLPCTAVVRLPQLFGEKIFKIFFFRKKNLKFLLRLKNGIYKQKNTLTGKETWFSFEDGIQIGYAKAFAL